MRYEVRAQKPVLVQPASEAESHAPPYFLTNLDQAVAAVVVESILVFDGAAAAAAGPLRHAIHPANLLKEGLRKVLVHFYPLAGRLRISPVDSKLFIECNGQGVLFVEADANVELSQLGDFSQPDVASLGSLVFSLPDSEDRPLLSFQVTKFKCGGFVLGFVFQHCLFDGVAALEFLSAWGETVRGLPLSTPPVLDRTFLATRSPLQISYPHIEFLDIKDVASASSNEAITRSFCFTPASLDMLRKKALEDGVLTRCTVFEALSGLVWKARTEALWSGYPEQKVKLLIAVDGRSNLKPGLPKGYMGNGLLLTCALASARELGENPMSQAVKHVQDAIKGVTEEYMRSQLDYMERDKLGMPSLEAALGITTWSKLLFSSVDFGWGKPRHVGPVSLMVMEAAIFLSYGQDGKGINVVLALPPQAMLKFEGILHPFLNPVLLSPRL